MRNHVLAIRPAVVLWIYLLAAVVPRATYAQRTEDGPSAVTRVSAVGGVANAGVDDDPFGRRRRRRLSGAEVGGGIVLGVAGGTVIGIGAGYAGAYMATRNGCHGEDCGLEAAILGFFVGESIGVATGAHIGAGGKGNLLLETVVTSAITAAGIAVIASYGNSSSPAIPITLGAVPLAQLAAVLAIEAHGHR